MPRIKGKQINDGAIDTTQLADDAVTAAKLGAGAVDATALGGSSVTAAKLGSDVAGNGLTGGSGAAVAVGAGTGITVNAGNVQIANGGVDTTQLATDAVTGAKIADDSIDSEHIVADSIDAEHYAAGSVDTTALGADAVTGAKIADDAVDSEHITDGSVDNAHLAGDIQPGKIDLAEAFNFTGTLQKGGVNVATTNDISASAEGLDPKESVIAASLTNVVLADACEDGDTVGGVTLATGDRVLLAGQTDATENGIYVVAASGAPTRATDTDTVADMNVGCITYIEEGTNEKRRYVITSVTGTTMGTDYDTTWSIHSAVADVAAGVGLTESNGVLAVNPDGTTLAITGDTVQVMNAGVGKDQLNTNVGGEGIIGGAGSALSVDLHATLPGLQLAAGKLQAKVKASSGLTLDADGLSVNVGSGALEYDSGALGIKDAGIDEAHLAGSVSGTGMSGGGGAALSVDYGSDIGSVGIANANGSNNTAARSDHTHKAPIFSVEMPGAATAGSGNYQTTGRSLSGNPFGGRILAILINGVRYELGNGVRTKDCYFSADSGANAVAQGSLVAGNTLYWNGTIAGFDLDTNDEIDMEFQVLPA
jgi:hypothetical protein